jgi:hypothetical protein
MMEVVELSKVRMNGMNLEREAFLSWFMMEVT